MVLHTLSREIVAYNNEDLFRDPYEQAFLKDCALQLTPEEHAQLREEHSEGLLF